MSKIEVEVDGVREEHGNGPLGRHLSDLLQEMKRNGNESVVIRLTPVPTHAKVIIFQPGGKYYTEDSWRIPEGATGPEDMRRSPDYRHGWNGPILVPEQDPWGYPRLFLFGDSR
jgi:hypothetical protein